MIEDIERLIEELREKLCQYQDFMQNPEPGLFTWHEFRRTQLFAIGHKAAELAKEIDAKWRR